MRTKRRKLSRLIVAGLLLTMVGGTIGRAAPAHQADTVTVSIEPPMTAVAPGEIFTVAIQIETGPDGVDSFETTLHFDPDHLRVVDPNTGQEANEITPGSDLNTTVENTASNALGQVRYVAVAFPPDPTPSGSFDAAYVPLKAISSGTQTNLTFSGTIANLEGYALPLDTSLGTVETGPQLFLPLVAKGSS